jgi:hypothetical protein
VYGATHVSGFPLASLALIADRTRTLTGLFASVPFLYCIFCEHSTLGGVKAILASVDQRVTKEAAATTHGELVIKIEGDVDVVQQALDDFKDEAGLKLTEETEKVSEKVDTLGARVAVLDDMASECGAAGHLYTKDGCKEIPIPDANLAKYDGKGCNTDNAGLLHYHKIK